jgi:hypothetical protein
MVLASLPLLTIRERTDPSPGHRRIKGPSVPVSLTRSGVGNSPHPEVTRHTGPNEGATMLRKRKSFGGPLEEPG